MLFLSMPHFCAGPPSFSRADKTYYIEIDVDLHQPKRLFQGGFCA
jgi:hypothetical protein